MGGRALLKQGIETRRVDRVEYDRIKSIIIPKLSSLFDNVTDVKSYKNKSDFGDIDILVSGMKDLYTPIETQLKRTFPESTGFYSNNPVWSLEYDNFQVDVIKVKPENWEIAQIYLNFNDIGNLLGRLYHSCGLSFGHEGLQYTYRTETNHVFGQILISTDPRKIYEFLGYDYDRYLQGFDTLEDIFEYVTTSPYFDTEKFNLDDVDMSHQNRTRNRKRKTFMQFLDYVKTLNKKIYFVGNDKILHIFRADKFFPEARLFEQMETLFENERKNKNNSFKYNGELVMQWTGKQGKELGAMLDQYKMTKNVFHEFLDDNSAEFIKQDFMNWFGDGK